MLYHGIQIENLKPHLFLPVVSTFSSPFPRRQRENVRVPAKQPGNRLVRNKNLFVLCVTGFRGHL